MNINQTFFLNGQEYLSKGRFTISELLNYFDYNRDLFILEHNNFICKKQKWDTTFIENNNKIEIISIVGGG